MLTGYKDYIYIIDLISSIVEDFKNDTHMKDVDIRLSCEHFDYLLVEADKGRIAQVISNLVNNAVKFANKDRRTIFIGLNMEQQMHNNGVEKKVIVTINRIDPEILPRLFTKFASKSETGGTGLGLFISKSIIESHGGKIGAENNADGKGATFYFILPIN